MKRFNLSEWSITHQALVLFMIIVLGAAGAYSYVNLGRAEDPYFTIKTMVIQAMWPGASAEEVATAVLYLLSENASYVTGANLRISGGR